MTFLRFFPCLAIGLLLSTGAHSQGGPPPLPVSPPPPESGQPEAAAEEWYVAVDGEPRGPMGREQAVDLISGRGLPGDTLVWREGMPAWTPLADVTELRPGAGVQADGTAPPEGAGGPPPIMPERDATKYHVDEGGTPVGPLAREEIERRVAAGSINAQTLVWHEGMPEWGPASATKLSTLFADPDPRAGADPVSTIVGNWRAQIRQPVEGAPHPVVMDVALTYDASGKLSGSGSGQLDLRHQGIQQPVTLRMAFDGTWSGEAVGATHVRVHSRVTVRMSVPELNMPEETEMLDEASVIEIVDRNTLRDDDGTIIRRVEG